MLRESVINNLSNCILPFWEGMMDPDFGGFYGMLDRSRERRYLLVYDL